MDLGLQDRRALITAASKGLGRASAASLAAEGAKVFVSSRNEADLRAAAEEVGAAGWRTADVSSAEQIEQLLNAALETLGGLDILVCNAGGPPPGGFDATDEDGWRTGYDLTLMSAVRLIRGALSHLRRSDQGRIVIITSITARQPIDDLVLSNAYRPAVTGLAKTLSRELGPEGITVNCIAPESINTDRVRQLRELSGRAGLTEERLPLRRLGEPAEVGALCAYLCSRPAGFITGQTVGIDGGGLHGIH
jgi:3-oxoacyl-[acyl-carrier protein] reductase